MKDPLIVYVLKALLHLVGWLSAAYAAPLILFCGTVKLFINWRDNFKNSKIFYVLLWFPRWLTASLVVPVWLGESIVLAVLLRLVLSTQWTVALCFGGVVISAVGFGYAQKSAILSKITPKFTLYQSLKIEAQLDLLAFISFVFATCCIIRIPSLIFALLRPEKLGSMRTYLYKQVYMTFVDLSCLPAAAILCVTVWRIPTLISDCREIATDTFQILNELKIREALNIFLDVPVFGMGSLCIILFAPWRIYHIIQRLHSLDSINSRRAAMVEEVGFAFQDFGCFLLAIAVFASVYRAPTLFMSLIIKNNAAERRDVIVKQFGCILLDILTIFCMIILGATVYRFPRTISEIRGKSWGFDWNTDVYPQAQGLICWQFWKFLEDLPFIILAVLVTALLWRAPFLWIGIVRLRGSDASIIRRKIWHHWCMLFVDVLDIPFVIATMLITVTVWRCPTLWREILSKHTRNQRRKAVLIQFLYWLWDIPTCVAALVVLISVYRTKPYIRQLKEMWKANGCLAPSEQQGAVDPESLEENPKPNRWISTTWHLVTFHQLGLILLDLPFPLIILLTLWRMPWLLKRLRTECDTAMERRLMILRYLLLVVKDIPCIIVLTLMLITGWRIPTLIDIIKEFQRGDDEHKMLLKVFLQWLIDVPFVCLGIIICTFVWRAPFYIRRLFTDCKTDKQARRRADIERRILTLQYVGVVFLDILCAFLACLLIFTLWRIKTLIEFYRWGRVKYEHKLKKWEHTLTIAETISRTLLLSLLDIVSVVQMIFLMLSVFHVRSFITRMYHITKCYYLAKENPALVSENHPGYHDWKEGSKHSAFVEESVGFPLSLSFYRKLILSEFVESLYHFPHLALLPLKLLGLLSLPCYWYLQRRFKKPVDSAKHTVAKETISFLQYPLMWLCELIPKRLDFWGIDQVFILCSMALPLVLVNDVALLIVVINSAFMFIVTGGSPLWKAKREAVGWINLGDALGTAQVVENFLLCIQIVAAPIYVALQMLLLVLPIIVISLSNFQNQPTSMEFWTAFFSSKYWSENVASFEWFHWIIVVCWLGITIVALHITIIHNIHTYPLFNPPLAYFWLVKRVIAGKVWGGYKLALVLLTKFCFKQRRTLGCLGELLMFPGFTVWAFWGLAIPFIASNYIIFAGVIPMCLFLCWKGYRIVSQNWQTPVTDMTIKPVLNLSSIRIYFDAAGDLMIVVQGEKTSYDKITQTRLWIRGDSDICANIAQINETKPIPQPLYLCPHHMNPKDIHYRDTYCQFEMHFRGVQERVMRQTLQDLLMRGIEQIDVMVEYGRRRFGWKTLGCFGYIPGLRIRAVLYAMDNMSNILTVAPTTRLKKTSSKISVPDNIGILAIEDT